MPAQGNSETNLVLAAEDFEVQEFHALHKFSANDERVIAKLIAHGPVLLQGSRGSGKSALMREAAERLPLANDSPALGVYLSLRHMPLLRSAGDEYQRILCELLIDRISRIVDGSPCRFDASPNLSSVQAALTDLAQTLQKRIVLMFDDAAHIGREASLADFFDVFRTLGSSAVSCKATIYPGVTNFGNRFDVYNDATVVDVIRDEDQAGFGPLFADVLRARYPELAEKPFASDLTLAEFASFVGKSVLGNMRSFIFACNYVANSEDKSVGLPTLSKCFLDMTTNFYWPLIDEVKPKLGKYVPVVGPSKEVAETLLSECGRQQNPSVIVHRDIISRLAKAFEILEYVGFISKRESSKAMKSGGRGSRYAINLCMLLENVPGTRLTAELFQRWKTRNDEPVQLHSKGISLASVRLPDLSPDRDPEILNEPVHNLRKSLAYPYGLSERMIEKLQAAQISTVRNLYEATDQQLDAIEYVGEQRVQKLRNVVAQAIWL
ncbi:MAG: ATP-binding protein [Candidatus Acidiferrales bacterium]